MDPAELRRHMEAAEELVTIASHVAKQAHDAGDHLSASLARAALKRAALVVFALQDMRLGGKGDLHELERALREAHGELDEAQARLSRPK